MASDRSDYAFLIRANLIRRAYSYLAQGKNLFDICEIMAADFDGHPWRVYDMIRADLDFEKIKRQYARAYLIHALSHAGFNNTQISKIAGYTPQRCGQILKKAI